MNNCLLIVDVQRGFINQFTQHIPEKVALIQAEYDHVYISRFYNEPDSFFRNLLQWHRFDKDSLDFQLAFQPASHATVLDKDIYSCVTPGYVKELNDLNAKIIDICGIDTDICVTKCAVDLLENNFIPRVIADYCGSTAGVAAHENGLVTLERYIGKKQVIRHKDLASG